MSRFIPDFPGAFVFSANITIRITDINYGGHVGNDTILSIIHDARVQYLHHLALTELDFAGTGLIMKQVAIDFKNELFYGDALRVFVTAGKFSAVAFSLFYKLEIIRNGEASTAAVAVTNMVCFDYQKRKITALPEGMQEKLI